MKQIILLIGTRPNFIKITQFRKEAERIGVTLKIIHSGQHYDHKMSGVFFEQFKLVPDYFLDIPKGISAAKQIASIVLKLDEYIADNSKPDLFLAVGDVNSTLAGALFAHKSGIPLGHIESGLRSGDEGMPEEINRILTDKITDYFFVTEQSGYDNLISEKIDKEKVFFVGNSMIDTLVAFEVEIDQVRILEDLKVQNKSYALMTMHRPATVDVKEESIKLISIIKLIIKTKKLVFPIHPRTQKKLEEFGLYEEIKTMSDLVLCPPIGYFEFQKLIKNAGYVITDSGGIQEETTFRQIPCITLRPNTERPSTITTGSNTLVPSFNVEDISVLINSIEKGTYKKGGKPEMWDGQATKRIFDYIHKVLNL
jgi:UDP-N-acetylglucosamine 2-epimerase (non-hydrolysing)